MTKSRINKLSIVVLLIIISLVAVSLTVSTTVGNADISDGFTVTSLGTTQEYDSLEMAVDTANAKIGSTVTLYEDALLTGAITTTSSLTINLNGHKIYRDLQSATTGGNIINNSGVVTITDTSEGATGTITGGYNTGTGGAIFNSGTLNLDGGTITGNRNTCYGGGNGTICNLGTFKMNGGAISHNSADNGGAIYSVGTVIINGGTISNNTATSGGAIYTTAYLTVNNGSIISNTADYGAGICNFGHAIINYAEIEGNHANYNGGGIDNDGEVSVFGGKIINNSADQYGGGVYIGTGLYAYIHVTDLLGGIISDNTAGLNGGGVYYNDGDIVLGGGIRVSDNKIADCETVAGCSSNIFMSKDELVIFDSTFTGHVGISSDAKESDVEGEGCAVSTNTWRDSFSGIVCCDNESYSIAEKNSTLYIVPANEVSVVSVTLADNTTENFADINQAVDHANDNAGSTIKLLANIHVHNAVNITNTVTFDLNSFVLDRHCHTATADGYVVLVANGAELTITDSSSNKTGVIAGGYNITYGGGVRNQGTLNLVHGTITNCQSLYGGGIYNEGTLNITGGLIDNNIAENGAGLFNAITGIVNMDGSTISNNGATEYGGGIYNQGTITIDDGSINNNSAINGGGLHNTAVLTINYCSIRDNRATDGGGLYLDNADSTTTLLGGHIAANIATAKGSGINYNNGQLILGGSIVVVGNLRDNGNKSNLYIASGNLISFSNEYHGHIGLTSEDCNALEPDTSRAVSDSTWKKDDPTFSGIIFSDFSYFYAVAKDEGTVHFLRAVRKEIATVVEQDGTRTQYIDFDVAFAYANSHANSQLFLRRNVQVTSTIVITGTMILNIHGYKLSAQHNGSVIIVETGADLTITDWSGNNSGLISDGDADFGGAIHNKGTLTIESGTISGNNATTGGGVYNNGTMTIEGGIISGNTATDGGGVYNNGILSIKGGEITDNLVTDGGAGVYNNDSLTIGGGAMVHKNFDTADNRSNVYLPDGKTVEFFEGFSGTIGILTESLPTAGSDIVVTNSVNNLAEGCIVSSGNSGYIFIQSANTLKLAKFAVDAEDVVYGQRVNVSSNAMFCIVDYIYSITEDGTYSETIPTNVGEYYVKGLYTTVFGNVITSQPVSFNITKASINASNFAWNYTSSITYDGTAHTVSLGSLPVTFTVSYTGTTSATAAGSYQAVAVLSYDSDNYQLSGDMSVLTLDWTISKLSITAPTADDTEFTYNGEEQTYTLTASDYYTVTGNAKTDAGTYTVTVSLSDDSCVWSDDTTTDKIYSFVIRKQTFSLSESSITFADKEVVDNGSQHSIVIGGTLPEGITVSYEGNKQSEAGKYTVKAVFTCDSNYSAIEPLTAQLHIKHSKLTYSDTSGDIVVTVTTDGGFDSDTELTVVFADNQYDITISINDKVISISNVTIALVLPVDYSSVPYALHHNDTAIEYDISDNLAIFSVDKLSSDSFTFATQYNNELIAVIIILAMILIAEFAFIISRIRKNKKDNGMNGVMLLLGSAYVGQLTAVVVLATLCIVFGIYAVYLCFPRRKAMELNTNCDNQPCDSGVDRISVTHKYSVTKNLDTNEITSTYEETGEGNREDVRLFFSGVNPINFKEFFGDITEENFVDMPDESEDGVTYNFDDSMDMEEDVVLELNEASDLALVKRNDKSFTARLIQSPDYTKYYYEIIKNALLSYRKVKSRVSWSYDSFNSGRNQLAKLNIRGKTLCLYLALDVNNYIDSKYIVERVETKKYHMTACLYRIRNARRLLHALELIEQLADKYSLNGIELQKNNYYLPFQTTEELIASKLIKERVVKESYAEYRKRQGSKGK